MPDTALGLASEGDVRNACAAIVASLGNHPMDGFLVMPMREPATELIVGVANAPGWGLVLAVGFGGILTEIRADTSLRRLPVDRADVHEMLGELEGSAILDGVRGREPVEREALVDAVLAIADAASFVGEKLEALEVNPLVVDGNRIEALDALVSWRTDPV
ncbi:MAG: acetate--CoA ligase family protein [Acidimicrobiales bacterium]